MDKYILKRRIGKNEATPEIKVTTLQGEIKFKKAYRWEWAAEDKVKSVPPYVNWAYNPFPSRRACFSF